MTACGSPWPRTPGRASASTSGRPARSTRCPGRTAGRTGSGRPRPAPAGPGDDVGHRDPQAVIGQRVLAPGPPATSAHRPTARPSPPSNEVEPTATNAGPAAATAAITPAASDGPGAPAPRTSHRPSARPPSPSSGRPDRSTRPQRSRPDPDDRGDPAVGDARPVGEPHPGPRRRERSRSGRSRAGSRSRPNPPPRTRRARDDRVMRASGASTNEAPPVAGCHVAPSGDDQAAASLPIRPTTATWPAVGPREPAAIDSAKAPSRSVGSPASVQWRRSRGSVQVTGRKSG